MTQDMKQREIVEGNKLIAEFMGWKEMTHTNSKNWMLAHTVEGVEYAIRECSLTAMRFNISWDWLMPVVFKLKMTLPPEGWTDEEIYLFIDKYDQINSALQTLDISKTHNKVFKAVEYFTSLTPPLTWYNSQAK